MAGKLVTHDRPVEAPVVIDNPDAVQWDDNADVVVVGFGGAGACAAVEAREQGADVLAIDRFGGGGATRYSGGLVYLGGGTPAQQEAGVSDTVEEMAKYLALEVGDASSPEVIQRYCADSLPNYDWLTKHGVPFSGPVYTGKAVLAPEGYFLQYSGNEKSPAYASKARPAARGHRTVGVGFTGYALYDPLRASAEAIGVRVLTHSPVTRLLVDGTGRVIGVEVLSVSPAQHDAHQKACLACNPMAPFNAGPAAKATHEAARIEDAHGQRRRIRARKGVVLSTGGFSHNHTMLGEHAPLVARNVHGTMRMASLGCDGSGHRLGESAGGMTTGMERTYLGRIMVPATYTHGVMVNKQGGRFCAEDAYNSILGGAILAQPDAEARLIVTATDMWKIVRECLFSGMVFLRFFGGAAMLNILFGGTRRAKTISALARKCGMDPTVLERTVASYNASIGGADEFGKVADNCAPLKDTAYYAVNFSLSNTYAFSQFFTLGGLSVDEDTGAVLRPDGTAVCGLYAAGRTAFGLCSNNYVSGLSLGDNVFSGRRAGRHAANSG
jgi:3-oxo-5alpha-steroid 4-dehydrogenase